jgi:hypothetical protein
MKKLKESQASINVQEEIDISRIQKLAGIMNASTATGVSVAEAMGASEEQRLSTLLNNIEAGLERVRTNFQQYVTLYERTKELMDEEEQMHFSYGVRAMIDMVEDVRAEMLQAE